MGVIDRVLDYYSEIKGEHLRIDTGAHGKNLCYIVVGVRDKKAQG